MEKNNGRLHLNYQKKKENVNNINKNNNNNITISVKAKALKHSIEKQGGCNNIGGSVVVRICLSQPTKTTKKRGKIILHIYVHKKSSDSPNVESSL